MNNNASLNGSGIKYLAEARMDNTHGAQGRLLADQSSRVNLTWIEQSVEN